MFWENKIGYFCLYFFLINLQCWYRKSQFTHSNTDVGIWIYLNICAASGWKSDWRSCFLYLWSSEYYNMHVLQCLEHVVLLSVYTLIHADSTQRGGGIWVSADTMLRASFYCLLCWDTIKQLLLCAASRNLVLWSYKPLSSVFYLIIL